MQTPDVWGDIPFCNYTYSFDSLLNSPDSLKQAESLRMLRDIYVVNVESSQGANQFLKFYRQCSENWLPSLFSFESFTLKLILLLLLVVGLTILFVPALRNRINSHVGTVRMITVCLCLMFLAVPLGKDYYPIMCITILSLGLLILFLFIFARLSLLFKKHWFWTAIVLLAIITAFVNFSQPIPSLSQVKVNDNPIDNYFLTVTTALLLFTVLSFVLALHNYFDYRKSTLISEKKYLRKQNLGSWALCTWCLAFLLYFIGIYYSGTQRSILTSLLRPALSASKIFILADNTGDITLAFRRSGIFMGILSLTRLSGFLVSAQFIINLLGARIKASIKIRLAHCYNSSLYVFFNINNASVQVAKTISDTVGNNPLVVFVDTYEDNISNSRMTFGFGSFMSLFTHKKEAFETIDTIDKKDLPALIDISSSKLDGIFEDFDSFSSIGLRNLQRLINESSKTEFFFLSDDEKANIAGAKKLTGLLDNKSKQKYMIYCNCRNNSLSQLLQFNDYRIETVDFAKLAIDQLKNNQTGQLTDLLDFDDTGCCCSPFRSLVIGLNEIGEEAVNYLYEYGAFVNHQKKRSDFECNVIDRNMHDLEGGLYMHFPVLKNQIRNVRINLLHYEVGSHNFWNWIEQQISSLNFILISLRNEDEQLTLADDLYNLAVRRRPKDAPLPLRIFICAYSANSANKLNLMAETYSNLNSYGNVQIVPFGLSDKLFDYQYITKQKILSRAKQFYQSYQKATEKLTEEMISWEKRRENVLAKEKDDNSTGKLASILELLRMESQDISNEYHRRTKISIIKRALALHDQHHYSLQEICEALPKSITYDIKANHICNDDYLNTLIENIAVLEHIRWEASHEIQGFQYDANVKKQIRSLLKKHPYMVDWSDLTNEIKLYDFAVVITSLMIEIDE